MNTSALIFIFGWLGSAIVLILASFFVPSLWGGAMRALGILGLIAWTIGALWLANAMNTDI
jgi:hypothetical protein